MDTLVLKVEYDGTRYAGWQRQKNAISVQQTIEEALKSLTGVDLSIIGAGRTDAGVHASGQIAHSRLTEILNIPQDKLTKAINFYLPDDIRIIESRIINYRFHSTKDAVSREYNYHIHLRDRPLLRHYSTFIKSKINISKLFESAYLFIGENDFTTFSKLNKETENYLCNVQISEWIKIDDDSYKLIIRANRFVYGMVRALVGVMIQISKGKLTFDEVKIAMKKKDRSFNCPMAPAKGLILTHVFYPDDIDPFKK